jgi:hypothetical protein
VIECNNNPILLFLALADWQVCRDWHSSFVIYIALLAGRYLQLPPEMCANFAAFLFRHLCVFYLLQFLGFIEFNSTWSCTWLTSFIVCSDDQYFRHISIRRFHFFELFPIIFGVVLVWVYATILTVAGAYNHASALGQLHCRTDRSGLVSHAPW